MRRPIWIFKPRYFVSRKLALSDKWREFRNSQVDTVEAVAISKCEAGDYATGIPVLEDALITARMPLPAPGYRWPGQPIVMR